VKQELILASKSSGRLAMLTNAGVDVRALSPFVDEVSLKQAMIAEKAKPKEITDSLAEAKALKISWKYPRALVIGSDQMLETETGALMDKPESVAQAKAQLRDLSGSTHKLISAVVVCEDGQPVWRHFAVAKMTMRVLSADFIDHYSAIYWDMIRHCVGCYRYEAEGAQLFTQIEGSHFTVIGMPLLPLLDYLRVRGVMPS
jgi:septum formation protein